MITLKAIDVIPKIQEKIQSQNLNKQEILKRKNYMLYYIVIKNVIYLILYCILVFIQSYTNEESNDL